MTNVISDADWGIDDGQPTANEVLTAVALADEPDEELSSPIRCIHCGELHSVCSERAAELLRSRIRAAARDRLELAERLGYHPRSSGFVNALGKLRGLGLVDGFALHRDFAQLAGLG